MSEMRKPRMSLFLSGLEQRRHRWPHGLSVQIFALQPHLHIKLEVIFLTVRAYGIVNFKLLIVFVQFELAARTSLSLNRSGELCAFVLSNLAIGEHRQRRYFALTSRSSHRVRALRGPACTTRMPAIGKRSANPATRWWKPGRLPDPTAQFPRHRRIRTCTHEVESL
jgi:hypothetical protein